MDSKKVSKFMQLAGQEVSSKFITSDEKTRKLGAQLLLSEVLEYVIHGLGVIPEVDGRPILAPNELTYKVGSAGADRIEMLDGLADVAYTMYWNALAFGAPLEEAFELVCDNNLEKFVKLQVWTKASGAVERERWHLDAQISWPPEVVSVEVILIDGEFYGVGKDKSGKVRKPSSYRSVDLSELVS